MFVPEGKEVSGVCHPKHPQGREGLEEMGVPREPLYRRRLGFAQWHVQLDWTLGPHVDAPSDDLFLQAEGQCPKDAPSASAPAHQTSLRRLSSTSAVRLNSQRWQLPAISADPTASTSTWGCRVLAVWRGPARRWLFYLI